MVETKSGDLETKEPHYFESFYRGFNVLMVDDSLNERNLMSFVNKVIVQTNLKLE